MQNQSSGTFTCFVNTENGCHSLALRLIETGALEHHSILRALQQGDLHLHFLTSGQGQTYRMSRIDYVPSSSPIQATSSAILTLNKATPEPAAQFNGTSFAMRAISIFANPAIFTLALLAYVLINFLGLMTDSVIGLWQMVIFIASLVSVMLLSASATGRIIRASQPKWLRPPTSQLET